MFKNTKKVQDCDVHLSSWFPGINFWENYDKINGGKFTVLPTTKRVSKQISMFKKTPELSGSFSGQIKKILKKDCYGIVK